MGDAEEALRQRLLLIQLPGNGGQRAAFLRLGQSIEVSSGTQRSHSLLQCFRFAFGTGLSASELLALEWADIDANSSRIHVSYASQLLTDGANPMYVAQPIGHRDWGMIRSVYGRFLPANQRVDRG